MSARYVDGIGQIVNERVDIVEVVSQYVQLQKSGRNYKGLCPFHHEKTPSLIVSSDKQIFKCFGCGESGNAISFIMKIEHLDFIDSLEHLAQISGFSLDEYQISSNSKPTRDLSAYYELNRQVAKKYFTIREQNKELNQYFVDRGLSLKTIRRFGLGFSPDEWDFLTKSYVSKLDPKVVKDSGLFMSKKQGGYYDRFRGRAMFPIFDIRKRVIGFGARTLREDEQPKYLNSPDTPIYNKSEHLYGLHLAKDQSKKMPLYLVEGYMDVLAMAEHEITTAVASLGTSLTIQQAKLIERYANDVIVLYDGDQAGIDATARALEILDDFDIKVEVLHLPEKMDPDDFLKREGKEGFLEFAKQNKIDSQLYRLKMLELKYKMDSFSDRYEYLKEAVELIKELKNPIDQRKCVQFLVFRGLIKENESFGFLTQFDHQRKQKKSQKKNTTQKSNLYQLFLAIVLDDLSILEQVVLHKNYIFLPKSLQEVLNYVLIEQKFDPTDASQKFSIDILDFVENARKRGYTSADKENWKSLYQQLLRQSIEKMISSLKVDDFSSESDFYIQKDKLHQKMNEIEAGEVL